MLAMIKWIERDLSRGEIKIAKAKLKHFLASVGEQEREFLKFYFSKVPHFYAGSTARQLPSEVRFKFWREQRKRVN